MARRAPLHLRGRGTPVIAAIDVGTNSVRLEVARLLPDTSLEVVHQERDPIRPGEGSFGTGSIPREVEARLIATLRRYGALCRRFHARVRAVATSALREAKNRQELVARVREETGIELEIVSGKEEARLICLGVLHGRPSQTRSLVIDIGGGSTEIATADGEVPTNLWSVAIGAVRLSELLAASARVGPKKLALLRSFAAEAFREALPRVPRAPRRALGSSGTIGAVIDFASDGAGTATIGDICRTVDRLAAMTTEERRRRFDHRRAEIIVAGAVILEALARHLGLESVTAVQRGLRHGLLVELGRRHGATDDRSLADAALAMGRRLGFDEAHAVQVARLGLGLYDAMAEVHRLPAETRGLFEVASLLHDVGHAVSYQRHHKHSYYLLQNADLPGMNERSRELAARIARYHRRSAPERSHSGMAGLTHKEFLVVRKLATLLRVADALDRSHLQPLRALRVRAHSDRVTLVLVPRGPLDLELWDLDHEAALFRRVFGRRLDATVLSSDGGR